MIIFKRIQFLALLFPIALMGTQTTENCGTYSAADKNDKHLTLDKNILLQAPQMLSQQEIEAIERESFAHGWGACWNCKDKQILLMYHDGVVEVGLELYGNLSERIDQQSKLKFVPIECTKDGKLISGYRLCVGIEQKKDQQGQTDSNKGPYCVCQPRNFKDRPEENKPNVLTVQQCADLIKTKGIVFYTGAGISAQAGVWMMQPLMNALGIDRNNQYDQCCHNIITHPEVTQETFSQFCYKAFTAPATSAHKAMTSIALAKRAQILTENFDLLHEHAGIKALHIDGPWLRANVGPDDFKNIDVIVCVALSYDDRGFLGWYKMHNPNGVIIALDLITPFYLGNEDFLLKGDCQKTLPELQQVLEISKSL